MSVDSRSPSKTRAPAFQEMTLDILSGALNYADNPATMSSRVVEEIRALTGARTVILLQCLHTAGGKGHRIVGLDPQRRRKLAESAEVDRLAELTHSLEGSVLWPSTANPGKAEKILAALGCGPSIATPLRVGDARIGCLLLLDLPEDERGIPHVVETLDMLSTVIALVFRTAVLHETQEATIEERTRELANSNDRLNAEIDEGKRAEAEREKLIEKLEAQNAELERFTYTVSHDLKSPLITIKGYAGLLRKEAADGDAEAIEDDLWRIDKAADKMELLLDELLELSRIGRLVNPPEDVPLEELAREAAELVAGQTTERGVEVEISPDLPVLFGDRRRLLEVLQNLLDNAVKYLGDQPRPRVEVGARLCGDETICYVRDNGIGIEPRYHEKVFGLFDQLDPRVNGSGIGLALAKRIIEVHGGRIWVESEGPRHGSTFCFSIPRKNEPASTREGPRIG